MMYWGRIVFISATACFMAICLVYAYRRYRANAELKKYIIEELSRKLIRESAELSQINSLVKSEDLEIADLARKMASKNITEHFSYNYPPVLTKHSDEASAKSFATVALLISKMSLESAKKFEEIAAELAAVNKKLEKLQKCLKEKNEKGK